MSIPVPSPVTIRNTGVPPAFHSRNNAGVPPAFRSTPIRRRNPMRKNVRTRWYTLVVGRRGHLHARMHSRPRIDATRRRLNGFARRFRCRGHYTADHPAPATAPNAAAPVDASALVGARSMMPEAEFLLIESGHPIQPRPESRPLPGSSRIAPPAIRHRRRSPPLRRSQRRRRPRFRHQFHQGPHRRPPQRRHQHHRPLRNHPRRRFRCRMGTRSLRPLPP